jgi:uncharacterized membrane protein YesL
MNKHRVTIGWLFVGVAMLLAVFLVFAWNKSAAAVDVSHARTVLWLALAVALLFCAVGVTLLLDYRYSVWICLPFSLAILFSPPLGTMLGAYYLWYFWKFVYKPKPD